MITEGLGGSSGALTYIAVTPDAESVSIEFSDTIALAGTSEEVSSWSVDEGVGAAPVNVLAVTLSGDGRTVTLTTTEHQVGGEYTLVFPRDIVSDADGTLFSGPYTHDYLGVGELPFITMVKGVDARAIDIVFSEAVLEADALDPANYTVIGPNSVTVTSVAKQTSQSFRLYTTPQDRNESYTIEVRNVRDLANNEINDAHA